jgi:uncharacterized protein (TIGR02453 family)
MKYLSKDFFRFFEELENNNNKEWFDANRSRYEGDVKVPFRALVQAITDRLVADLPEINREVPKAVFRINRDIRFSKDKTPYKNHASAVFARKGTKDEEYPALYIHIGSKEKFMGGGSYMTNKETLQKIRQEIYYNPEEFKKLINSKDFKGLYGEIKGEKNKVLTPDYKEFAAEQPLIANKAFYYSTPLTQKDVLADGFDELVYKQFKPAIKFNRFLWRAING